MLNITLRKVFKLSKKDKTNIFYFCWKKAFTLSEVLITLAIIGVVAALTTPVLMSNIQEKKVYPALAKFVSTMSNGIARMMQETGISDLNYLDAQNAYHYHANRNNPFINELLPYISIEPYWDSYRVKCSGCSDDILLGNHNTYRLKDGMVFFFDGLWFRLEDDYNIIGYFLVDINGPRKPNIAGVDVFKFYLGKNGRILPAGSDYVKDDIHFLYICKKTNAVVIGDNFACTADIMEKK